MIGVNIVPKMENCAVSHAVSNSKAINDKLNEGWIVKHVSAPDNNGIVLIILEREVSS